MLDPHVVVVLQFSPCHVVNYLSTIHWDQFDVNPPKMNLMGILRDSLEPAEDLMAICY